MNQQQQQQQGEGGSEGFVEISFTEGGGGLAPPFPHTPVHGGGGGGSVNSSVYHTPMQHPPQPLHGHGHSHGEDRDGGHGHSHSGGYGHSHSGGHGHSHSDAHSHNIPPSSSTDSSTSLGQLLLHALLLVLTGQGHGKKGRTAKGNKTATAAILRRRCWPLLLHVVLFWFIFVALFMGLPSRWIFSAEAPASASPTSKIALEGDWESTPTSSHEAEATDGVRSEEEETADLGHDFHHCILLWQAFSLYFLYLSLACISGLVRLIQVELVAIIDSEHHLHERQQQQLSAAASASSPVLGMSTAIDSSASSSLVPSANTSPSKMHNSIRIGSANFSAGSILASGCTPSYSYGLGRLEVMTVFTATVIMANMVMFLFKESLEALLLSGAESHQLDEHHGMSGTHMAQTKGSDNMTSDGGSVSVEPHAHARVVLLGQGSNAGNGSSVGDYWIGDLFPRGVVVLVILFWVYAYGAFYVGKNTNAMRGGEAKGAGQEMKYRRNSDSFNSKIHPGNRFGIFSRIHGLVETILFSVLKVLASFGIFLDNSSNRGGGILHEQRVSGDAVAACVDHIASAALSCLILLVTMTFFSDEETSMIKSSAAGCMLSCLLQGKVLYPVVVYNMQILFQTMPKAMIHAGQIDKCLREAATFDGVLEFRKEHFWSQSYDQVVGSLHVRIRRDANEQVILRHVTTSLSRYVSDLTVHIFKDDWGLGRNAL